MTFLYYAAVSVGTVQTTEPTKTKNKQFSLWKINYCTYNNHKVLTSYFACATYYTFIT